MHLSIEVFKRRHYRFISSTNTASKKERCLSCTGKVVSMRLLIDINVMTGVGD